MMPDKEDKLERFAIYALMIWGVSIFVAGFIFFDELWVKVVGLLLSVGVGVLFRKKL